jgi:hypothetical protein
MEGLELGQQLILRGEVALGAQMVALVGEIALDDWCDGICGVLAGLIPGSRRIMSESNRGQNVGGFLAGRLKA